MTTSVPRTDDTTRLGSTGLPDDYRYLVEVIEELPEPSTHARAIELTPAAIANERKTARLEERA
jgi:hypothetical protein